MEVGLVHYLTVAAVMFGFGLLTVMTRKNAVGILLGVELILNAAALNFIAFEHFVVGDVGGQIFRVFSKSDQSNIGFNGYLPPFIAFHGYKNQVVDFRCIFYFTGYFYFFHRVKRQKIANLT